MIKNTDTVILTGRGVYFDVFKPEGFTFDIGEIADSLSKLCRFNGHTNEFYSVAQHSVLVSLIVPIEYSIPALLHDAHEAYIGDMVRPIKGAMHEYRAMEDRVQRALRRDLGLPETLHPSIGHADLIAMATERRDLMPHNTEPWESLEGIKALPYKIKPLPPKKARKMFLTRVHQLLKGG